MPVPGGPSDKVELMARDKIIKVNGVHSPRYELFANGKGDFPKGKLIVLINELYSLFVRKGAFNTFVYGF